MSLNRAAALAACACLEEDPTLRSYALLPAVRAELWARLGDRARTIAALEAALALPGSDPERAFLRRKRHALRA